MPKIVDKTQMERQIAQGALALFIQSGFHKTTMAQIAAHLGMAKGNLYRYFTSKEQLIGYLMDAYMSQIGEAFMPDTYFETLDALFETLMATVNESEREDPLIPVFFEAFGPSFGSDAFRTHMGEKFDNAGAYYRDRLGYLQEKGEVRSAIALDAFARMLVSMIDGIVLHRSLFAIPYEKHRHMLGETLDVLKQGLRP